MSAGTDLEAQEASAEPAIVPTLLWPQVFAFALPEDLYPVRLQRQGLGQRVTAARTSAQRGNPAAMQLDSPHVDPRRREARGAYGPESVPRVTKRSRWRVQRHAEDSGFLAHRAADLYREHNAARRGRNNGAVESDLLLVPGALCGPIVLRSDHVDRAERRKRSGTRVLQGPGCALARAVALGGGWQQMCHGAGEGHALERGVGRLDVPEHPPRVEQLSR